MRTCPRCGSSELRRVWEPRSHRLGRLVLSGTVASVRCSACGVRWPWAQWLAALNPAPWIVDRLSPALAYLQAEGDLIVVRRGDGQYEVVA